MWQHTKRALSAFLLLLVLGLVIGFGIVQLRGGKLLSVQSGSMMPNIKKGDLVAVTRVPTSQLVVGDVITFINPNNSRQTITHRITEIPKQNNVGKITTKGDANALPDKPILTKTVIGR